MAFSPEGLGLAGEAPPGDRDADCLVGSVAGVILACPRCGAGRSHAKPVLPPRAPGENTAFTTTLPCVGGWKFFCSSQKDGVCFDVLLKCPKWGWGCCVSLSILPRYHCCLLGALKHSGEPLEGKMWG